MNHSRGVHVDEAADFGGFAGQQGRQAGRDETIQVFDRAGRLGEILTGWTNWSMEPEPPIWRNGDGKAVGLEKGSRARCVWLSTKLIAKHAQLAANKA